MSHPKNQIRYPKAAAAAETTSRKQHGEEITRDEKSLGIIARDPYAMSAEKMDKLTRSAFELAGAHPFVFDAIAFLCTHYPKLIDRKDDSTELHFKTTFPIDKFFDFALDGRTEFKHLLMTELYELARNPKGKMLPLDKNHSILTVPIRVSIVREDGQLADLDAMRLEILKQGNTNIKGLAKAVIVEFYKPLFSGLLQGKHGRSWFPLPKAFHAQLLYAINKYRDSPSKYPVFSNIKTVALPLAYRKLYLYLNLHDNGLGERMNLDAIDLMLSCYPSLVKTENGIHRLPSWTSARSFVQKGSFLFNQMGLDGLMVGGAMIPESVWYNQAEKKYSIKVHRESHNRELLPWEENNPQEEPPPYTDEEAAAALEEARYSCENEEPDFRTGFNSVEHINSLPYPDHLKEIDDIFS